MPHRLPHTLLVIRAGLLSLVLLAGLWAGPYDEGGGPLAVTADPPGTVQRVLDRHDCSTTGFADDEPASVLVRTPDGHLRLIAYDRGVFALARAGSVVAVCLDEPPRRGKA
ncbi:hypothetical protein ASC77_25470 [Nocardioides sp. Root1257]|uniref:hypothetical protein n=1 Tax=unclassified Nocardioides TaxID=2615069 RepID=UPI0006FE51B1|nr:MULTISPECIES: hypothetical protein [unclassified Nocardioides]KQW50679.1 hypothetical protein ASC77_25470 [Nocardioides sp. Root1257]KRC51505.1 hypothetical protein ASE24_25700 [Nocardioides sp. Root224]